MVADAAGRMLIGTSRHRVRRFIPKRQTGTLPKQKGVTRVP